MAQLKLGVVVGSNRRESINRKLAQALAKLGGAAFDVRFIRLDDLPMYNQDLEQPVPEKVARFKSEVAAADALLFVTPEHSRSVPAVLKNAIDWGARPWGKSSWGSKPAAIIGTSGGALSTAIAQQHLRTVLGAVDTPIDPSPGWSPRALLDKIAAGAEFIQTQFGMDIPLLRRYLARLAEHGVPDQVAIMVGLTPLRSARSAIWMRNHLPGTLIPDALITRLERAGDPGEEGKRICIDLLEELAEIPRIAGAHIMAPGNEHAVPEVIAQFRSICARAAGRA